MKKFVMIAGVIFIPVLCIIVLIILWNLDSKDMTRDIKQYEKYLGVEGKYKENYCLYNDIFPNTITTNMTVEDFCYYYYNPWDACYLGYLVCQYDDSAFEAEYKRLKEKKSTQKPYPYGIKDFPYELCALYVNDDLGMIYAVADVESRKIAYVELQFCNGFTDIDYEEIIDKKYLPKGFDVRYK